MFKIAFKVGKLNTIIQYQRVPPNKLSILGGFFQNNVGCQKSHLPRLKTKQKGMKIVKYLISNMLERICFLKQW